MRICGVVATNSAPGSAGVSAGSFDLRDQALRVSPGTTKRDQSKHGRDRSSARVRCRCGRQLHARGGGRAHRQTASEWYWRSSRGSASQPSSSTPIEKSFVSDRALATKRRRRHARSSQETSWMGLTVPTNERSAPRHASCGCRRSRDAASGRADCRTDRARRRYRIHMAAN